MVGKFCVKYEASGSRDMEEYFLLLGFLNLRVLFCSSHGHKITEKLLKNISLNISKTFVDANISK